MNDPLLKISIFFCSQILLTAFFYRLAQRLSKNKKADGKNPLASQMIILGFFPKPTKSINRECQKNISFPYFQTTVFTANLAVKFSVSENYSFLTGKN
jgi:hypothetical protein